MLKGEIELCTLSGISKALASKRYGLSKGSKTTKYLTCIKFRVYKISRFREFGLQFAKLNPREYFKNEVDSRNIKSTF